MAKNYLNRITENAAHYTPGEQVNEPGWIKLNTNESPLPPSPQVLALLSELAQTPDILRKYSHPLGEPLLTALHDYWKLEKDFFMVTNGSDEALAILCRATLSEARSAAFPEVTYSLYETLVKNTGGYAKSQPMVSTPDLPYSIDLEGLAKCDASVIFLPNPNAITGEFIEREKLTRILETSDKLWIIDEAYNDFAGSVCSMIEAVPRFQNLVVTRTFSKTHALAGLRVGFLATSNKELMRGLLAHKDSYNADALATRLAAAALKDRGWHQKILATVAEGHAFLRNELTTLRFHVYPSRANFFLARVPEGADASGIVHALRDYKILIRYYAGSIFSDCVRISVGSSEENTKLVAALKIILSKKSW